MKFEGFATEEEINDKRRGRSVPLAVVELVDRFFKEFVENPIKVGPIINMSEPGELLPSEKQLEAMDRKSAAAARSLVMRRSAMILREIKYRMECLPPHFRGRYDIGRYFIGSGKLCFFWKQRKPRKKKETENDGGN